jgi:hypothetical protein
MAGLFFAMIENDTNRPNPAKTPGLLGNTQRPMGAP